MEANTTISGLSFPRLSTTLLLLITGCGLLQ